MALLGGQFQLGGTQTLQAAPPVYPAAPASPILAQITDHVARAQSRLLSQYADKTRVVALLAAFTGRTQVVENALWGVLSGRTLANAVGAQLDGIGRIVGLPRSQIGSAADDAVYRKWLAAQIRYNVASSTIPDLIALFQAIGDTGTTVKATNSGTATVWVRLGGAAQSQGPALVAILARAAAGGVRTSLDYMNAAPASSFGFDGAGAGMDAGVLGGSV